MQKKLTITIDEKVYEGLYKMIGKRKIGQFIEGLVRPHVIHANLESAYCDMAADRAREADAHDWSEGVIGDVPDA
jgi:hypothetical protein